MNVAAYLRTGFGFTGSDYGRGDMILFLYTGYNGLL